MRQFFALLLTINIIILLGCVKQDNIVYGIEEELEIERTGTNHTYNMARYENEEVICYVKKMYNGGGISCKWK